MTIEDHGRFSDDEVDETDLMELHKEFNICMMKMHSDNPNLWFMELECIKTQIITAGGNEKSEPEMVT